MHFVKASVYQQEITKAGIKEKETSARNADEEKLHERLLKLPEFKRDPQFRSLSEQIIDGAPTESAFLSTSSSTASETVQNPYAPASVTEDEFEFYETLRKREKSRNALRQKEEEEMREAFAKARQSSFTNNVNVSSANMSLSSSLSPVTTVLSPLSTVSTSVNRSNISPLKSTSNFVRNSSQQGNKIYVRKSNVDSLEDKNAVQLAGNLKVTPPLPQPNPDIGFFKAASQQSRTDITLIKNRLPTPKCTLQKKRQLSDEPTSSKGTSKNSSVSAEVDSADSGSKSNVANPERDVKQRKVETLESENPNISPSFPSDKKCLLEGYSDDSDEES